jgi:hypothetical protein
MILLNFISKNIIQNFIESASHSNCQMIGEKSRESKPLPPNSFLVNFRTQCYETPIMGGVNS